ncbi:MAG: symmetrical bis(5'-nucleosyl)-tetraphosphatase [Magnetococcales bacterium]|nr:symmetrical bis(5'-nucleosyl)-tetraphosphatase [Magnetococcales bacterium]
MQSMAVYAIGDVHGCLPELQALLDAIPFRPEQDQLWFVGDLINRGPDSLGTLRFVRSLGERAVAVMGNHEGRAVASLSGMEDRGIAPFLQALKAAPDAQELEAWLRAIPLFHCDRNLRLGMVHAGISPAWSLDDVHRLSADVGQILRDPAASQHFFHAWDEEILEAEAPAGDPLNQLRFAFSVMTRLRMCTPEGRPLWPNNPVLAGVSNPYAFDPSRVQNTGDFPFRPWFELRPDKERSRIVYGHWAAAGLTLNENAWGLDSGCVYGGKLTAMRLDHPDHPLTQVRCPQYVSPESF